MGEEREGGIADIFTSSVMFGGFFNRLSHVLLPLPLKDLLRPGHFRLVGVVRLRLGQLGSRRQGRRRRCGRRRRRRRRRC